MFTGFPKISPQLLDNLIKQGFVYFVRQRYTINADGKNAAWLFSPFKESHKAEHYFQRLQSYNQPEYFDMNMQLHKKGLYGIASNPAAIGYVKIIEHNYKLDDDTRYQIAAFVKENYPSHFELMAKNNFRIVIGDNFGDVFYTIRIGQGILLPVQDASLNKYRNNVPGSQQVLRLTTDL